MRAERPLNTSQSPDTFPFLRVKCPSLGNGRRLPLESGCGSDFKAPRQLGPRGQGAEALPGEAAHSPPAPPPCRASILEMRRDHEEQLQRLKLLKDREIDAVTSATSHTRYVRGLGCAHPRGWCWGPRAGVTGPSPGP